MSAPHVTSRVWYLVGVGLLAVGVGIGFTGFLQGKSTIAGMQRVVMPGKHEVVLPAGTTTLYAEQASIVAGEAIRAPDGLAFRCAMATPAGEPVALVAATAQVSYSLGGYSGRNAFDVDVAAPGTYVLSCDAPAPFAMAVGGGIGAWIVVAVVGGLVPGLLGAVALAIVAIKRGRQRRRAAA